MDKYIIFGLLIVMALLLIIHLNRNNNVSEKFANPAAPNLQACPASLNKYTSDVSINCCDGDIVQGKCQGEPVCTLSEKTEKLPRCIDWYRNYLRKMSIRHCPSDLKQFFEDADRRQVGFCTSSPLNSKLTQPIRTMAPKCNVHKSNDKNLRDPNSCLVKKRMEKMLVPTPMSTKGATVFWPNTPVILQANYIDELQSKNCLDRPTADAALDIIVPAWRNNSEFKTLIYNKLIFCDTVKKQLEERAQDPNYKGAMTTLGLDERRRLRLPGLKFNKPKFNFNLPKAPKFGWKPKAFGVCK